MRASEGVAGNGTDGEAGEDVPGDRAKDGVKGNDGADACTADVVTGARTVVTVCDDGIEYTRGYGGDGGIDEGRDGAPGQQPEPADNPEGKGRGGTGAGSEVCTPGAGGGRCRPRARCRRGWRRLPQRRWMDRRPG
ncbi:hypothetical protein [Sorangium sp. So ce887]|uniref:hypothetical protein n=1 Tax=Sorangium sp. So ce887 TaxID=3133324 RepID=UPI003F612CFB